MIDSQKLKALFIEFFREKNHSVIANASLVPEGDPTALSIGSTASSGEEACERSEVLANR